MFIIFYKVCYKLTHTKNSKFTQKAIQIHVTFVIYVTKAFTDIFQVSPTIKFQKEQNQLINLLIYIVSGLKFN